MIYCGMYGSRQHFYPQLSIEPSFLLFA